MSFRQFPFEEYRVGRRGRIGLGLFSLFLISGFALAGMLTPSEQGHGTHQQLGLYPCTVRVLWGIPCPVCGMTTSFAHYVRGNLGAAWDANPAGTLLAVLCTALVPWSAVSSVRGRLWSIRRPERAALGIVVSLTVATLASWLAELAGWR